MHNQTQWQMVDVKNAIQTPKKIYFVIMFMAKTFISILA